MLREWSVGATIPLEKGTVVQVPFLSITHAHCQHKISPTNPPYVYTPFFFLIHLIFVFRDPIHQRLLQDDELSYYVDEIRHPPHLGTPIYKSL